MQLLRKGTTKSLFSNRNTTEVSLKILKTDPTYRVNMEEWRSGKVKLINFDKTKQELGREVLILLITDSIVEIVLQIGRAHV